jgi:hypothetical protein
VQRHDVGLGVAVCEFDHLNRPEKALVRRRTRDSILPLWASPDTDGCRPSLLDVSLGLAVLLSSSSSRDRGYGETGESLDGKK